MRFIKLYKKNEYRAVLVGSVEYYWVVGCGLATTLTHQTRLWEVVEFYCQCLYQSQISMVYLIGL